MRNLRLARRVCAWQTGRAQRPDLPDLPDESLLRRGMPPAPDCSSCPRWSLKVEVSRSGLRGTLEVVIFKLTEYARAEAMFIGRALDALSRSRGGLLAE